jgi:hypothetical protein
LIFMEISPEKFTLNAVPAKELMSAHRAPVRILHRKIARFGVWAVALLACAVWCAVAGAAQEERPQITPGERKVPRKKDAGPRAVAVLQMAANGKTSLIPVAILIGGKFWDATAYKADPIPMALDSGTVYEAERAGGSLGLFTVNSALHSNAVNAQSPWLGTGNWVPTGSETKDAVPKAESVPAGMDNSDGPPRLTRNPKSESAPAASSAPAHPASTSSSAPSPSGDEPPRLAKGTSAPSSTPETAPAKPGDSKSGEAKADNRANVPASDSGADKANRPMLRRGKPVGPLPEDDVPGYSKPGASGSATAASVGKVTDASTDKDPPQLVPAISDATGPDPRSFAFEWLKDEEGERRQQMTTLAKEQVRMYVEAQAKARIAPKPAGPQTARRTPAAKAKDPILENVKMTAYDLWANNQPVIVLSADAHMPPPPAGAPGSLVESEMQYSILLVAYPDTYNNLHKIYSGVTDKYHLDITPRLELVDAVDADGDRRGELLFREISDGGRGWVIYRASQDKMWKLFDSLHPE